jgi:hypothetical protein
MTNPQVAAYSAGLLRLIKANEPFWGGEAEVIRSYWQSSVRTPESDRKWLIHQIYKEYWDGVLPPLELFRIALSGISDKHGRERLRTLAEVLHEEVEHFALFADLHRTLTGSDYALTPGQLKVQGAWAENNELMTLRQRHKEASPELGLRAQRFTEGGYCALFTEGMALRGRGSRDDAIAQVCSKIYDDEFNHMLLGITEQDDAELTETDWDTLVEFTNAQMKARIVMRNAQFSHPVGEARMKALLHGDAQPVNFDFATARSFGAIGEVYVGG